MTGMPSVMAYDQIDPGVGRFHDGVGGKWRGHENHAGSWRRQFSTASATVLKTGTSSISGRPLPGVTPATTWVP
jgi:hypothetical protein